MKQSLADKLEAFAKDAGSVSGYARDQFLKTLGGCTRRNIGEITAALRERQARIYQPSDPSLESRSETAVFIGGMWPYGNSNGGTKPGPSSDIPPPSPEQEVRLLAEQCATLVAENEDLRRKQTAYYGWADEIKIGIDDLKAQNERLLSIVRNYGQHARADEQSAAAPLTVASEGQRPEPAEYDELTDELMRTTHGLLRITGGLEPDKTVARAIRAHALLLRLHSLAFPAERTNAKA